MQLKRTLETAKFLIDVISDSKWDHSASPNKLIKTSGKVMKEMIEIIRVYDDNQKRLIRSLLKKDKKGALATLEASIYRGLLTSKQTEIADNFMDEFKKVHNE